MIQNVDVVIVGTGVAGLFCALNLSSDKQIVMITKDAPESSNSFLAQGGVCIKRGNEDYSSFYEDTMKAGHYQNRPEAVDTMIQNSQEVIRDLLEYGVTFEHDNGQLLYTKEGGHSKPRILYHKDQTGQEISNTLLNRVKQSDNITILDHVTMIDLLIQNKRCLGVVATNAQNEVLEIRSRETVLGTGGVGGLYQNSTNFHHITGDALALALKYKIPLKDMDCIQIHPTTFYDSTSERCFLISESVRGEGAVLYNKDGKRFVNELMPRDLLSQAIYKQMKLDGTNHVWLSMIPIGEKEIKRHFPTIYKHCLEKGFDVTKEWIPVVPAQHYCMGGILVDLQSKTTFKQLYAVGEVSCNGVHGANRLASNSLLESLVFSKKAAKQIELEFEETFCLNSNTPEYKINAKQLQMINQQTQQLVRDEIERMMKHK
ncbi:L-aspartate oxidase [Anaerovorax sp. IOR16]|uniref:L-aspartate oxidase n=1 Tax=Anaerovorax sp. IOR16 TaxID=2773458 RepID=UPI0019D313E5|nr:L-aspartate oxidase [Anaerovorax sp. IOR16]